MIVFGPIMQMLAENGWNSTRIRKERIIPEGTLSRIRNNQPITTTTIETICRLCHCQPGDILSYIPDPSEEEKE